MKPDHSAEAELAVFGMPEPGTQAFEDMVDFMRADLESDMRYTKIEMAARKIMKEQGRDFDKEFQKWKEGRK